MVVADSIGLAYFSVQRTGSTAMERLLMSRYGGIQIGKKHSSYADLTPVQQSEWVSYTKVAGLRNPFDSLFSKYWKLKLNHKGRKDGAMAVQLRQENWDFNRFIAECETSGALRSFMRIESKTLKHMDAFIRFESMQTDWADLCRENGWEHEAIPVINSTNKPEESNYRAHCDKTTVAIIREHCGQYLNKYNYDF